MPYESAATLPTQYRWLLERIERFMENEHPTHWALPIFDTRDPGQNRLLSESFTGYMARSTEARTPLQIAGSQVPRGARRGHRASHARTLSALRRPKTLRAMITSPNANDTVWALECGHVGQLTGWDLTPNGRREMPEQRHCDACGCSQGVVKRTNLPPHGERGPLDLLTVDQPAEGLWRWTRYGRYGEVVDVSEDFSHVGAARDSALERNGDIPLR